MLELMFDLETLDTKPSAVVLSVGAVVWKTKRDLTTHSFPLRWEIEDRFYRVLDIEEQLDHKRTVSQSTLFWWMSQDATARSEAFAVNRQPVTNVLNGLVVFANKFTNPHTGKPALNRFWANPATFDFPIWEDLALTFGRFVPWTYRQRYDVRTAVTEASYSVRDHVETQPIYGVRHMPVYDCEWQIDLLTAARYKAQTRLG